MAGAESVIPTIALLLRGHQLDSPRSPQPHARLERAIWGVMFGPAVKLRAGDEHVGPRSTASGRSTLDPPVDLEPDLAASLVDDLRND